MSPEPQTIWELRSPAGGPAFYPYGEHLAAARMRETRERLIRQLDAHPTLEGVEMLAHVEYEILRLELSDLRIKALTAELLRDR